ncbi:Aste57867_1548 [Aphanomyces stellatus]|uniref:Aste57867_1548 protein n=1 Tax=Aphanomyces stellatus TaxID=120398 RepID=A0A485K6Q4_9STRA|nr:hypothetical protein As57867_001547 [Aphanomyces stellatus]VFT78762.1 Aste57867_1548 [Aphanomyces stellatus]
MATSLASSPHAYLQVDKAVNVSRPADHPCVLSWEELNYAVFHKNTPKRILVNAMGRCAPGELTAIMGPTGSGKTTLLDLLADRVSSGIISGRIEVNGKRRNPKRFRLLSSYVAQDDSLLGAFTVRETLQFAAKLGVAANVCSFEAELRVQAAIDDMGMLTSQYGKVGLRSCQDAFVGDLFRQGISGGQKRRLSIAIELLKQPTILLLDEPTSGLDSASTYSVVQYIKKLCAQNRTVVCTIHQPSSAVYHMFNNILLLAQGHTVFFGTPSAALAHFSSLGHRLPPFTNPGEFFLQLVNTDFEGGHDTDRLIAAFGTSTSASQLYVRIHDDGAPLDLPWEAALQPSPWRQLRILVIRNLLFGIRHPGIYALRLVMYILLCAMVGTVYLSTNKAIHDDDIAALLFYLQAFLVFMSVAVLPFFLEQRAVFNRERANHSLSVSSYVVATFVASLPGIALIASISSALVVGLVGLLSPGYFWLNLFLSLVVAESLMHVLAAIVPHYIIGIGMGAGLFGMFMVVEGFMLPLDAIPPAWQWLHYVAFHSYSFKSFLFKQFDPQGTPSARAILVRFGVQDTNVDLNMAILAVYAMGLQVVYWAILVKYHTGRR